jgi:hypothetical protein
VSFSEQSGTVHGVMSKRIDRVRVEVCQRWHTDIIRSEVNDPMSKDDIMGGENVRRTRKSQHCTLVFEPQKRYQSERQNIGLEGHLWYNSGERIMLKPK